MARHLMHGFSALRYDRRGYGKSWQHQGPYSVSDQVEDVERLLEGRKAVLFGHSYGGNVALAAAEKLGEQISGVSTFETPLSWMPWWPGTTAGAMGVAAGEEHAAEKFMIRLIGQRRWDALPERTKIERRREGRALVGELGSLRSTSPWNADRVTCRVLCGYGSLGQPHHQQGARWLSENVHDARLVCIKEAGHSAPMTHAKECVSQLVLPHFEG